MFVKRYIKRFQERMLRKIEWMNRIRNLNDFVLHSSEQGISADRYCNNEVIVSLTTYDKRLHSVYLTIESIMQQTMKPNKIILWLEDELKKVELPRTLQKQMKRGLEVSYYKNIRSYKKLIPTLQKYPNDVIITVDDDLIYEIDVVEKLVRAYNENPALIYFNRGHRITLKKDGKPNKYKKWNKRIHDLDISPLNFPTTGGGTLFPPHCFSDEVFNEDVFMNICGSADDVWFKAMALYNNVLSRKVYTHNFSGEDYLENMNVQDIALSHYNTAAGGNDVQLLAVFDKYSLYDKL